MTHAQFLAHLASLVKSEGGQSAFARKHGVRRQFANDILAGRTMPSRKLLTALGWTMIRQSVYTFQQNGGIK